MPTRNINLTEHLDRLIQSEVGSGKFDARTLNVHKRQRLLGRDPQRSCQHDREGERTSDLEQVHEKACLTDYLLCNLLLCQRSVLTMPL